MLITLEIIGASVVFLSIIYAEVQFLYNH